MSIIVLCPSRGNPEAALEAKDSCLMTATLDTTDFKVVVDEDDPARHDYRLPIYVPATGCMNGALNYAALHYATADIIGFVGDDHRFRTPGWDRIVQETLHHGGLAYGNDLAQGENLPTAVFISREIVQALGYFGLPGAYHLYLDDAWKRLGTEAGCLYYLPQVVIEHMHPAYGKGQWDENHTRVNSKAFYDHDRAVYEAWDSQPDVAKVRAVLGR